MSDPEVRSPEESRRGRHTNGEVMPPLRGSRPQESSNSSRNITGTGDISSVGLEKIMARFDKLESLLDANDRRLEKIRPPPRPDPEPPYDFPDVYGAEYDDHRRRRTPIYGQRLRNHNSGFCEQLPNERPQRRNRGMFIPRTDPYTQPAYHQPGHWARQATCWDLPAVRQPWDDPPVRYQKLGLQRYDQPRLRQPSCWAPSQARQTFCRETAAPPSDDHYWQQPDQPDVSSSRRTLEYPPSRNTMASFGQSGLYPNVSSAPPRHHTTESTNRRPDFEPPLSATIVAKQPRQNYLPPPPLPRSDRQPQHPSPPPPWELLPYAALGPFQPLHPLPVTAPFAASNLQPQAIIPSSMKKERETNIQEGEERMEIENIIVEYKSIIETTKSDSDGSITSCPSFGRVRLPSRDQVGVEEELLDDGPPQSCSCATPIVVKRRRVLLVK